MSIARSRFRSDHAFLTASRYVTEILEHQVDRRPQGQTLRRRRIDEYQTGDRLTRRKHGYEHIPANGHPEAFQMVETGARWLSDGRYHPGFAGSASAVPGDYVISSDAFRTRTYGIMSARTIPRSKSRRRRNDRDLQEREINKITPWFCSRPTKGLNYNVPMSGLLKVVAHPTTRRSDRL